MENERDVTISEAAADDLFAIYLYLAERIGAERAKAYTSRIETFCDSLGRFSKRGRTRIELGGDIHSITFESQVVIAYRIVGDVVDILRIIHGSQDYDMDSFH